MTLDEMKTKAFWMEEQAKTLRKIANDSYIENGVHFWKSTGRPVPVGIFKDAGIDAPENQEKACNENNAKFLADYRKRMENHVYSEEELYEMKAAFGEGATIVNAITGKTTTL